MTYFKDGDSVYYHKGPLDADSWHCPLVAIGWLEQAHEYTKGNVPSTLTKRIAELRPQFWDAFSENCFRGLHDCSLCEEGDMYLPDSHINLFIPASDRVYVAPGRIDHYIEIHGYLPPASFIEALSHCPDPRTSVYRDALFAANRNERPPLYPERWIVYRLDDNGNRLRVMQYHSEEAALTAMKSFEDRGAKQKHYLEKQVD